MTLSLTRQTVVNRPAPRAYLLAGVSVLTLASASVQAGTPFRSLNQALSARMLASSGTIPTTAAAKQAAIGARNFQAAAHRFADLSQALASAGAAANSGRVPDGLTVGGLQPATGYLTPTSPKGWIGVAGNPLTQTVQGGRTTVTVTQTAPQAVLNWRNLNVGAHTTLHFDQSAGGKAAPTWSVLNRIEDPALSPTLILGSITAEGQVLVLNQNGVLFGAGAQVNLHSLVAGAVTMTNTQYLTNGLYSVADPRTNITVPSFVSGGGGVTVSAGATIVTTQSPSITTGGGSVILLGNTATNEGSISTPGGQTILAGGRDFILLQGFTATQDSNGAPSGNLQSTVVGSEIAAGGLGTVTNAGIIEAVDGDITLNAQTVVQSGLLLSTTSVNQRGTIHLLNNLANISNGTTVTNISGQILLAPGSVTEILPDDSGTTALSGRQTGGYTAQIAYGTPMLPDEAALPDRSGVSRIEITTGGTVTFTANSLSLAPGGQIATDASSRIFADTGAQLDVSGLTNVTAPITQNLLGLSIEPFNLRDSPLNNSPTGVLNSSTVYIDARSLTQVAGSTVDASVRDYTAGGLFEVSGEIGNVGHTADEWATVAGRIMLYAAQVIARQGSVFNIAGGNETFNGGAVRQSYLLSADGTVYNVNTAPANLKYLGVYKGVIVTQPRWHATFNYVSPLLTPATINEPSYTVGRDAGQLVLSTPTTVFAGTINGGVSPGPAQLTAPSGTIADPFTEAVTMVPPGGTIADPFTEAQTVAPRAGAFLLTNEQAAMATSVAQPFATDISIVDSSPAFTNGPSARSALPGSLLYKAILSASALENLGNVTIASSQTIGIRNSPAAIAVDAPLTLASGGQISLTAPVVDVRADITAPSGSITLQTSSSGTNSAQVAVTIATGVALNATGVFSNEQTDPGSVAAIAYRNGGMVSLQSAGALSLDPGSSIDVSAGGQVTRTGFSGGTGGSVSIVADDPTVTATPIDLSGAVKLDASITGYGSNGGGTLSITAPAALIGATPAAHPPTEVDLAPALFTTGFTNYLIDGFSQPTYTVTASGVTVQAGTQIVADVPVLIPTTATATSSGAAGEASLQPVLLPGYFFNPGSSTFAKRVGANVTLTSGSIAPVTTPLYGAPVTLETGASITVDAGQKVTLSSLGQVTALGTITAHGGTISLLNLNTTETAIADFNAKTSVWVGGSAVLDASAVAVTTVNADGNPIGIVPSGGSIVLGGNGNFDNFAQASAGAAFVFVRPGAVLNASGTSAPIALATTAAASPAKLVLPVVQDATSGGTITVVSAAGIYLGGQMLAAAGGPSAAGGTFRLQLDTAQYNVTQYGPPVLPTADPAWTISPHEILVSNQTQSTPLPPNLQPGSDAFLIRPDVAGQAAISEAQLQKGGFGNVDLFARDQIAFNGSVNLAAPQSINLIAYTLTDPSTHGSVNVSAPYVLLAGAGAVGGLEQNNTYGSSALTNRGGQAAAQNTMPCEVSAGACTRSALTIGADLIDVQNTIGFGVNQIVSDPGLRSSSPSNQPTLTATIDAPGFNTIALDSGGDIRLASNNNAVMPSKSSINTNDALINLAEHVAALETQGNLTLSAASIYPETGVSGTFTAGFMRPASANSAAGTLTVSQAASGASAPPLSTFGSLTLQGGTINQGGTLYAPLGAIVFNATNLNLLAGSTSSVSAKGLVIPFGGTTDGVNYIYASQTDATGLPLPLTFLPAAYGAIQVGTNSPTNQGIALNAVRIVGAPGSVLDVSGGGTLTGGGGEVLNAAGTAFTSQGFISGSGGSTDVLYSTIISFNAAAHTGTQSAASTNPLTGAGIYAIVPASNGPYAPGTLLDTATNYAGSVAQVGEQITLGNGVPGLQAGTYTLLPSYYALLPGAYRVQIAQGSPVTAALPARTADGLTYQTTGFIGIANTPIQAALPESVLITPEASVLRYSQYDQQSYESLAVAQAATFDNPRPFLPQDAGVLNFTFQTPVSVKGAPPARGVALTFGGMADLQAASGGYDGAVGISTGDQNGNLVILGTSQAALPGSISLPAQSIDILKAPLLVIGGFFNELGGGALFRYSQATTGTVTVNSGATLNAGAVWLMASSTLTVDPGAQINTLGFATHLPDSSTGALFISAGLAEVAVANGSYTFQTSSTGVAPAGSVVIGGPTNAPRYKPATLYSGGLVGVVGGAISIATNTAIGAADFSIAVPEINVGTPPRSAAAPTGYTLTSKAIAALLTGNPALGVPAATTLDLTATGSLNFFGDVSFSTANASGAAASLVLTTPAIYGYGTASQAATLTVGNLIWNGSAGPAGPVAVGGQGTGNGTLNIDAQQIVFGFPAAAQSQNTVTLSRVIAGFATVNLNASDFVSANNHSALGVYQSAGAYQPGTGISYAGGTLNITTPLLTTDPGANLAITAGGPLNLAAPAMPATITGAPTGLGGEIDLAAASITDASSVVLPGGLLSLASAGDINLEAAARIDLAGRAVAFFDVTRDSFGGVLKLTSAAGNVIQAAGSTVDISAAANRAGTIDISAAAAATLDGTILGSADPGFAAGGIGITAGALPDLSALDTMLNAGGVFGSRRFRQTGTGDVTIGSGLVAHDVSVSIDGGSLTIAGTIDASGAAPGTIDLAASAGLIVQTGAILDAHGSVPQTDQSNLLIPAENTAHVNLTVSNGTLTIMPGATFDLAAPNVAAHGDLEINVPRSSLTGGGANISAAGPLNISGAGTIAVNAFWTYTPDNSPSALVGGVISQTSLNSFNVDSQSFITNALAGGLVGRSLAGLLAYTGAFRLRPGIAIESSADVNGGTLTTLGDLNLVGYRYASVNAGSQLTSTLGSGEPGVLLIRAAGNLDVFGSITDGFAAPPPTPDDNGWVLQAGTAGTAQNVVVTQSVTLAGTGGLNGATTYPVGDYTLGYAVTVANGAQLSAGAPAPADAVLAGPVTLGSATVLIGTVTLPGGKIYRAGSLIPADTTLPPGTLLAAGTILPAQAAIGGAKGAAGLTIPVGTNFSIFADTSEALATTLTLRPGDTIPAGASIQFTAAKQTSITTRPPGTAGTQGQLWGVAPLLTPGNLSWSLSLVSGADLAAADPTAVLAASTLSGTATPGNTPGSLVLSDTHYGSVKMGRAAVPGTNVDFSVVRTGTGSLHLASGGDINEASLFGIYTAGVQSADVTATYSRTRPAFEGSTLGPAGDLAGANGATYNSAVQASQSSPGYEAYYPTGGGDLIVSAAGNINGDTYTVPNTLTGSNAVMVPTDSSAVSNWLWWQGAQAKPGVAGGAVPSAWWINYGTFLSSYVSKTSPLVVMSGFTGFGTLGGGNATVSAGGSIGTFRTNTDVVQGGNSPPTTAVDVTVASTGRANPATGQVVLTGGGTLTVVAGHAINPLDSGGLSDDTSGTIANLRGTTSISAASIGSITPAYLTPLNNVDPRPVSPFASETFAAAGGLLLVLGDSSASLDTRGDLVLLGAGNPTFGVQEQLGNQKNPLLTGFSLWQPTTSVDLSALGGSIVPVSSSVNGPSANDTTVGATTSAGSNYLYPPSLRVTAYSGNVDALGSSNGPIAVELAPSATGNIQVLAGTSILNTPYVVPGGLFTPQSLAIDISGAGITPVSIPTPLNPETNAADPFFAFEEDTATGLLHVADPQPARFYAVSGDVLGLVTGERNFNGLDPLTGQSNIATLAAKAVDIRAGRDVIGLQAVALNNAAGDISTILAGRDVVYATEQVAGPGQLQVQAGRNVYEGDVGSLVSTGEVGAALTIATRDSGAGITVLAGTGAGLNPTGFADLYLNAANLANPVIPLQNQPGRVVRTYQTQLLTFLQQRFDYIGTAEGALTFFMTLPTTQQTEFLLGVYFAELNQSGLDYNNPASRFYHSYLEGNLAVRTLFPATDPTGKSPPTGGNLTLFSGTAGNGSIRTLFGGGITTVVPFGQTSLGNFGFVPGPSAGILSEGGGDINAYSYGSVSLGQSRILTTFGGNILIWLSSSGEINAGRGSKSTVLSAPIGISYDNYGNVTLSPTVPSSGAGIGTLSPIPQVQPGNVNLVAPVGTIDAGEAGIRASGNANLAALTLLNANNIQVSGKTTGTPSFAAPSAAAQAAVSSAAGAAAKANQTSAARTSSQSPSVVEVEVVSISGASEADEEERKRRRRASAPTSGSDRSNAVRPAGAIRRGSANTP